MAKILVTGAAGFIGFHLSLLLMKDDHEIIGIDNLNDYYDVKLKKDRLDILKKDKHFTFYKTSIENKEIFNIFEDENPEYVVNLAAQAGVRYSLENPYVYLKSNMDGFLNILEACRHSSSVKHCVYASSSSVYGANKKQPFSEQDNVDHPVSLYAATKKSNELMAHVYSSLFDIPVTGLRFFTVYGPWGRPDMALFKFTKAILEGKKIDVYNFGNMKRDFTYVDDIVKGVENIIFKIPEKNEKDFDFDNNPCKSFAPYRLYNIGNNNPEKLMYFIECIENSLKMKAEKNLMEIQPGDVPETFADTSELFKDFGFKPSTPVSEGIQNFIKWYRDYYQV